MANEKEITIIPPAEKYDHHIQTTFNESSCIKMKSPIFQ